MDHCERKKRKRNPRETANIFSLITFAYTGSLFRKAYKNNDLEEDDLYDVLKACSSKKCGDETEKQWMENRKDTSSSIYRLMWARFGYRYILRGSIHLCWKIFNSVVEPWAFSQLISYFKPGQTTMTKNEVYYYAALVLGVHLIYVFYIHNYVIWVQQLGLEIKTSFSSLLYRKALKLSPSSVSEISLGNIVTLITRDVHTFEQSIWIINDAWIGIVQTCIICYLLYAKLGFISFTGIGILLSVMPLQVFIGNYVSKLRLATGKKTDERLQVIQETLSTMSILKMYNWEEYFSEKINAARLQEINKMLLGFYLKFIIVVLGVLFSKLGFYILIMSYIWLGYTAEAELVFYVLTIFRDLRHTLGVVIPVGIGRGADLYSAIVRINKVIQGEELQPKYGSDEPTSKPFVELKEAVLHIKETAILRNVSFSIRPGLTLVTGSVGSGKTTLLKTILQDYPLTSGSLTTSGRISYASQDPWLFPSSIRQNILFGGDYDEKRYTEVIRVCALEYDFSLFDKRDETIVTDKGANLSKGQQARVNLARAIYKESEIYLLDDSLTALDAHVQDFIFNECIKSYLKNKICVLVTHTTSHIGEADTVVIMDDGRIKYQGKPNESVLEKINELITEDDDLEKEVIQENHMIQNGHVLETEQQTTKKKIYSEVNRKGEVEFAVYKKYFIFGGGFFLLSCIVILFGTAQGTEKYSDKLLTQWVDEQQTVLDMRRNVSKMDTSDVNNISINTNTSLSFDEAVMKEQSTIKLYSIMILVSTVFALLKTYAIFDFCRRASINIHKAMVRSIIFAVMSFFDTHFIGNILNRFSQDLLNIDEHLLNILSECMKVTFSIIGIVVLISVVNIYFLLFSLIFFSFLMFLRKLYLPTGRSLKRLEAATRSPMIGHLNASLEGLTTIRAYKAQSILIEEFDRHQDVYTSAHYTSLCSMRAFGFVMDFLCSIFIILVVSRFIFVDTDSSAGDVGLVLSQVFMLAGTVQWGVRTWADLENLMTSVERLLEYTEIPPESTKGSEVENWPSQGAIHYKNVSLTYNKVETVLDNLNFTVEPQQKIGIVGRTGAGKTSIISSIFRLYDVQGKILIDKVDISTLSLKFLRQKLAIIPQDPVLFSGTIRTNLDPYMEFKDDDLWKVLEEVNIRGSIPSLGLKVSSSGGSSFSSGQKQLICLARAILRRTKIVILDEASANMDHDTDVLLHRTIKKNFGDCTVITIAHRLHSILECDKVMVLNRGEIKEFDDPVSLLKNKNGLFYKMVSQAGLLNRAKLYIGSLFRKAYKHGDIEEKDLYVVLDSCNSRKCGDKLERLWMTGNENGAPPSIYKLFWEAYAKKYLLWGFIELSWKIFKSLMEPDAVSNLVSYFNPGQTSVTKGDAYYYAALVLFLNIANSIFYHNYDLILILLGFEMKVGFTSFLYRKSLKLNPTSLSNVSLGNLVTLITKDVNLFTTSTMFMINDLWVGILQTGFICYLLYSKIGLVSFMGIGVFFSAIPLQIYLGKLIMELRLQTGAKTDERLQITQETLSTIRTIKMYTWEKHFEKIVNDARRKEMEKTLKGFFLKYILIVTGILVSKVGFYLLLMSYIWMGYSTDTATVFYILTNFNELKFFLGFLLLENIGSGAQILSASKRINRVIQMGELPVRIAPFNPNSHPMIELRKIFVSIGERDILKDITFEAGPGLTIITGALGSGKSTLIKTILQDYQLKSGHFITRGTISYASQDPWLFPSSIRQNILFGQEFNKKRYQDIIRICALRYDLSLFDKGDETIICDRGMNLSKGQQARVNLARAIYKDSDIYLLDDSLAALDPHVQDYIFEECIETFLKDKICILVSQAEKHIQRGDNVIIMNGGSITDKRKTNKKSTTGMNGLVSENDDLENKTDPNSANKNILKTEITTKKEIYHEFKKKGKVDIMVYKKYIIFGGGFFLLLLNVILVGLAQGADSYTDKLLTTWVDEKQHILNIQSAAVNGSTSMVNDLKEAESQEKTTFDIYTIMMVVSTLLALTKTYVLLDFCRRASVNIHKAMVHNVINAVMTFFDSHFIGNILNRFSKDLANIDEPLPFVLTGCFGNLFSILGNIILIATINSIFLLYAFIVGCLLFIMGKCYLPTGRSLKRLEAMARSPMIGHLNSTLEGVTTIRSYGAENILREEFDKHQDLHTSAHFMSICSLRAFSFFMDIVCSLFTVLVVLKFVIWDTDTSAGWSETMDELENLMTSVERVLEYTDIQTETQDGKVVKGWPRNGAVKFDEVSLTYNGKEVVLKNLNFNVEPKQKIGIVGRTGAGKSSVISTLLRFYDIEGKVFIDGIDINSLSLEFLRRKMSIIPQDPILFSGTIRSNLDPFNEFTDQELWGVLGKTGLQGCPTLDLQLTHDGSLFSQGQKQLICLSRAILRKSKILILDEASANVDHETEVLLHKIIEENFPHSTIITIAHRMYSILRCDKVMVLDEGELREFDEPSRLLENRNGIFHDMVKHAGLTNLFS
ncbi:hypothetical protein JTB14_025763 [Gonioctena quinquepunctata]|nr:hypothetical protein JTB14_025763 [Gonioctena quinquepunctata]